MGHMHIAVVNNSTVVENHDVAVMVSACNQQVRDHLAPEWDRQHAPIHFYRSLDEVSSNVDVAIVAILDNADQANALGYHWQTPDGRPYARVFAKTVLDHGGTVREGPFSVSVTLSHEIIELFVDPSASLWADIDASRQVALEGGDPVEGDSYNIAIRRGGLVYEVAVSNFVLPAYFSPFGQSPFDYMHKLSAPFTMTHGGYLILRAAGNVTEQFGQGFPDWKREAKAWPAARTAKRSIA